MKKLYFTCRYLVIITELCYKKLSGTLYHSSCIHITVTILSCWKNAVKSSILLNKNEPFPCKNEVVVDFKQCYALLVWTNCIRLFQQLVVIIMASLRLRVRCNVTSLHWTWMHLKMSIRLSQSVSQNTRKSLILTSKYQYRLTFNNLKEFWTVKYCP